MPIKNKFFANTFLAKIFGDAITSTQIATPSTPSAGFDKLYPKADGSYYYLRPDGVEVKLGNNVSFSQVAVITDSPPSGTAGGTGTAGTFVTRNLNTVQSSQSWVSLASNQITLQPGIYYIQGSAPASQVAAHKIKLFDVTNSSDALIGSSEYANFSGGVGSQTASTINGVIEVLTPTVYEIQHRIQGTTGSQDFGIQNSMGVAEVYTQIEITRLADSVTSEVYVYGGNGTGSTDTFVRRFTTTVTDNGPAITYAESAANGSTFTINEDGIYAISYVDSSSGGTGMGLSKNCPNLNTALSDPSNDAYRLGEVIVSAAGANQPGFLGFTGPLLIGDVIRAQGEGANLPNNTSNLTSLRIVKVANSVPKATGNSEVCVTVGNGGGSTNTFVRRWTNSTDGVNGAVQTGTAITYADDAAQGSTFTINENGLYAMTYDESLSAADQFGISINQTVLTQAYSQLPLDEQVVGADTPGANLGAAVSIVRPLQTGDVIRSLWGNDGEGVTYFQKFRITKIR